MKGVVFSKAEQNALEACNISTFHSINLTDIKDKVSEMLGMIGRDGIFAEYTKHSIEHVNRMLVLMDTIIPKETQEKMTSAEWLLLVLSTYFHDLGMLVTVSEYKNRLASSRYCEYKDNYLVSADAVQSLKDLTEEEKEKFLYQEYVRHTHGDRIYSWILDEELEGVPHDEKVVELIQQMVSGMPLLFRKDLALLCRSHLRDDLDSIEEYNPKQWYGQSTNERANVFYLALILRTADLLHITSDRTPLIEYQIISPVNPKSQDEWAKQRAVASVQPKDKTDSEGNVDERQIPDTFQINALFPDENGFFSLIDYLNYARKQLQHNFQLNERIKKKAGTIYDYPWRDIDDSTIQTENFAREQLSFTIDQVKILDLLVGETLYNNHTVAIRELVQNAIDAVKVKLFEDGKRNKSYLPKVMISWEPNSREMIISDNGTGMNMEIIKKHLLKVGSSRYRDTEFIKNHPGFHSISRFGIGLLTCFLVADDVDIITRMDEGNQNKPLLLKIRNLQGKYLLKYGAEKDSSLQLLGETGTAIRLKIRPSIKSFDPEEQIRSWILFPGCNVEYKVGDRTVPVGYDSPSQMLNSILDEHEGKDSFKVAPYKSEGVELAILLKKNKYLNEWELVDTDSFWVTKVEGKTIIPWGVAIEGIRLNYDTPGFNGDSFVAVANLFGEGAPKTNVARSGVSSDSKSIYLQSVYGRLLEYINSQKEDITEQFSVTWANDDVQWLLSSMLSGGPFSTARLIDNGVFNEKLMDVPLVLVEENEERHFCSLADLKKRGYFWTVESESFSSANRLIREMHDAKNLTSLSILKTILGKKDKSLKDIDLLLCDASTSRGILEDLRNSCFEVSKLIAIDDQRRLDLRWETIKSTDNWFVVNSDSSFIRRRVYSSRFYFQMSDSIEFLLPEVYEAVKSRYGFFFQKRSPITKVVESICKVFADNKKGRAEVLNAYCVYVNYLISKNQEEESISFEKFIERTDIRIKSELLSQIPMSDINLLKEVKDFHIYDTERWYRS